MDGREDAPLGSHSGGCGLRSLPPSPRRSPGPFARPSLVSCSRTTAPVRPGTSTLRRRVLPLPRSPPPAARAPAQRGAPATLAEARVIKMEMKDSMQANVSLAMRSGS